MSEGAERQAGRSAQPNWGPRQSATREKRRATGESGGWLLSLLLHGGLGTCLVWGAWLGKYLPLGGAHPGTSAPGMIHAQLAEQVPGGAIPMPSPVVTPTKNRLASDNPAPGITRPRPRETAPKHSIALPSYRPDDLARKQALADLRKLAQAERQRQKDDRVAYGTGGRVSINATTSKQGAGGGGGMSFGDANFGNLYTDWVNHLRDRLQYYWIQQPRDPSLASGLRVSVTMTVRRDGSITGIRYIARSNSVEVNAMATQTLQQMAQQERFPLPAGYAPSALAVSVTFELSN